ncbi:MAG: DUF1648 domain-containing protein [Rhizobiales bacterium]|nr:DUF1648 domain-containing protein [Hyphomicrobiales bacterium]
MGGFKTTNPRQIQVVRRERRDLLVCRPGVWQIFTALLTAREPMKFVLPSTISVAVLTAMVAASLAVWQHVPPDMPLAIHFSLDGTPNGYASKAVGLWSVPAAALLSVVIFVATTKLDRNAAAKRSFIPIWLLVVIFLAAGHAMILGHALVQAH